MPSSLIKNVCPSFAALQLGRLEDEFTIFIELASSSEPEVESYPQVLPHLAFG